MLWVVIICKCGWPKYLILNHFRAAAAAAASVARPSRCSLCVKVTHLLRTVNQKRTPMTKKKINIEYLKPLSGVFDKKIIEVEVNK